MHIPVIMVVAEIDPEAVEPVGTAWTKIQCMISGEITTIIPVIVVFEIDLEVEVVERLGVVISMALGNTLT